LVLFILTFTNFKFRIIVYSIKKRKYEEIWLTKNNLPNLL